MGKYASAACDMLNWLDEHKLEGGPVSQPTKKDPSMKVYCMTLAGIRKLPKKWGEFTVTGTTEEPDYIVALARIRQRPQVIPCSASRPTTE